MKPTPEQIEAAAKALLPEAGNALCWDANDETFRYVATLVLTAAAEVEVILQDDWAGQAVGQAIGDLIDLVAACPKEAKEVDPQIWRTLLIYCPKEALTAAAGVKPMTNLEWEIANGLCVAGEFTAAAEVGEQYNPEMVASLLSSDKAAPEATIKSIKELAAAEVDDEVCITTHLWQSTGSGGSMGKQVRCDHCGKTKYIPW